MSLLIIVLVIVLVSLLGMLRQLLAVPFPRGVQLLDKPDKLIHPVLEPMYEECHAALSDLGFSLAHHADMRIAPEFLLHAGVLRLYRSADGLTLAQVISTLELEDAERCQVYFHSKTADGVRLTTFAWSLMGKAFQPPHWQTQMGVFPDVAAQFSVHKQWFEDKSLVVWPDNALQEIAQGEQGFLQWFYQQGYARPYHDGAGRLTLKGALRIVRVAFGRPAESIANADDVPRERLVLMWEVWKKRMNMGSPSVLAQWGLFLFSAALFVALGSWYWSVDVALLLCVVIAIHELGHWLAMRALGYQRVHMMLLPLAGGVTLGEEEHASARDRAWVALLGPLPGIVLAAGLMVSGLADMYSWLWVGTLMLVFINVFNLLPVLPLDGGHILQALLGRKAVWLSQIFCALSIAAVLFMAWWLGVAWFAVLAIMPFFALKQLRVQQKWLDAWQQYPEPENEMQARIQALHIVANPAQPKAPTRVMQAEQLLKTVRFRPMAWRESGVIVALWLMCFAVLLLPDMRAWLAWFFY